MIRILLFLAMLAMCSCGSEHGPLLFSEGIQEEMSKEQEAHAVGYWPEIKDERLVLYYCYIDVIGGDDVLTTIVITDRAIYLDRFFDGEPYTRRTPITNKLYLADGYPLGDRREFKVGGAKQHYYLPVEEVYVKAFKKLVVQNGIRVK